MDKEQIKNELWHSILDAATNLYYLDHFRDKKKVLIPFTKGCYPFSL
jgi:hypothetical protein